MNKSIQAALHCVASLIAAASSAKGHRIVRPGQHAHHLQRSALHW